MRDSEVLGGAKGERRAEVEDDEEDSPSLRKSRYSGVVWKDVVG